MKAKRLINIMIKVVIPATVVGSVGGGILYSKIREQTVSKARQSKKELLPYLLTTSDGMPLSFDVKDNITVGLNLSELETTQAINAIEKLDLISDTLNYTIVDAKDTKVKCDINISSEKGLRSTGCMGVTTMSWNENSGVISLPISIKIDESCINYFDTYGVNLCSYVVKHEMMHTLGFADLYSDKYLNKSCMYYSVGGANECNDFTELDINNIQKMYDDKQITVTIPQNVFFITTVLDNKKYKEEEYSF